MQALHPLVEKFIETRDIKDRETFLSPLYEGRHNPFLLKDMDIGVQRILKAIKEKETICVWHDYDCDGIPGGSLLFDFFRSIEFPVITYVPERSEGYGLNKEGIQALKDQGVTLVITVDCGITDNEEVSFAKEIGVDVIVTDHHLPSKVLPEAVAVINAHREDDEYPFKELCGTGVAFKLVEGLIQKGNFGLSDGREKWLLDLVALATVADMVSLTGENRALVHYGLKVIQKGKRPGLTALLEAERVPLHSVTEDDLAFSVAPKINAASRMKTPKLAFELLTTDDPVRAKELAKELVKLNQDRKLAGMHVAKDVKKRIEAMPSLESVIVMGSQSWKPSLLGLAATHVVETYQRTVCLWGMDGGLIKGSCRSDGKVNVVSLMTEAKDAFLDFGGHEMSGGFSLSPDMIHELSPKLQTAFSAIQTPPSEEQDQDKETAPGTLTLAEVTNTAYEALRTLAPFGVDNRKPVFRFSNVSLADISYFGAHKDHARLTLTDDSGRRADAIAFFVGRTSFKDTLALLSPGDACTIDACIERSYFRGRKELRLRIEDLSAAF